MNKYKLCLIVPCYNHESLLERMLDSLEAAKLPCFVIDDGSAEKAQKVIAEITSKKDWVTLVRREENGGKGAAVKEGFVAAMNEGFTHALQIDADCQHNVDDIPKFIEKSQQYPQSIILGQAVYDSSVPRSRLYGRYITHFWVMIETLTFKVIDTMCGFRVYPLEQLKKVNLDKTGSRMDFDVEMAVKAIWAGIPCELLKTNVIYPDDGISNFHYLKGNLRISWMHTKLFFGMLLRFPIIIAGKFK